MTKIEEAEAYFSYIDSQMW